jgi:predicted ABC-type ATPase
MGAGVVWVVAGPPGAGRSSVARLLLARLRPARMRLDREPAAPHHTVDNRLTAPAGLAEQVAGILSRCPN